MSDLIKKNKTKVRSNDVLAKQFQSAIHWVVEHIDDYDQLKWAVNKNLYPYVQDQELMNIELDPDIEKEIKGQIKDRKNCQKVLKKRLGQQKQIYKEDKLNFKRENEPLMETMNELSAEIKELV